jgi:hypothetical protein
MARLQQVAEGLFAEEIVGPFDPCQCWCIDRGTRIMLSSREMGRICHVKGVERLVCNDLWHDRTPERFSDAFEWVCSWKVDHCLAD